MRHISTFVLYFILGFLQISLGQPIPEKGYFMFPIKPGQPNFLTGSMGELRSNHFHAGIDIKTDFKIGLPVYCSADGYVSRIKISSYGYGKVLYITHPNGLTTVYAHLDKLNDTIGAWTLNKQYELQSFDIDVNLKKDELPVKKGQVIAKSGNTGSSGGPHLHYEIRDQSEKVWNPLLFGFKEITDTESPVFDFVALRSFGINARVENEFGRKDFTPLKSGKNFIITKSISASGEIGIEIKAHDRMNETHNQYGISCIEVKVNGKETFFHNINSFSFEDGKKINAHLDYETLVNKNQRFQRCYVSDGNKLNSYKKSSHSGKLTILSGQTYKIEITVYDAYSNNSTLNFTIDGKESAYKVASTEVSKGGYRIYENILKIKGKTAKDTLANFFLKGNATHVLSSYLVNGYPVYLYDLRNGLPDSITIDKYTERFDFVAMIPPYKKTEIKYDNFLVSFSDTALIDTLYLQMKGIKDPKGRHILEIHNPSVPIFGTMQIAYAPDKNETMHPNSYIALNGRKYEESAFKGDNLLAETKYLGKFIIVKDTIRPVVKYISHTTKSIKFNIFDTGSGIDSFKASIDGKWLLMNYEHKNRTIWSENSDKTTLLKGKFILEVKDKAGNITTYEKIL
jgi:hypothetical protein